MIALGLIGLLAAYVLLWSGFKGTDPRDEILAALRGGEAPRKLAGVGTSAAGSPVALSENTSTGDWGGSKAVADRYAAIGVAHGLRVTSEKRDKQMTASGGISDHWTGSTTSYAYDLSGSTEQMDRAAVAIMAAFREDYRPGSQLVETFHVGGYRIQILYRTMVGGNHYDHIHIGVRKL